jgi:hypothetical protein
VLSQDLPEVVVDGAVVVLVVEVVGEEVLLSIVVDETLVLPVEKSIREVRNEQLSLFCKLHHNLFFYCLNKPGGKSIEQSTTEK